MSDTTLTVTVPKELDDTLNAILDLVRAIKLGTPLVKLALEEVPTVIRLYGELEKIPEELKQETGASIDDAALFARKLVYLLLGKE